MLEDFELDSNGKKIHFERNNKLKPIGCNLSWTNEHILEYKRCRDSYQYFIEKYCRVLTENGMQIVKLRPYQQKILDDFHSYRYNALLAPRQCVSGDSIIRIKNKTTLDEISITILNLYNMFPTISSTDFSEEVMVNSWYVKSDTGWKSFKGIGKTFTLPTRIIYTKYNTIKCSNGHILFTSENKEICADKLVVGNKIKTINGIEKITNIVLSYEEELYDLLEVDTERYYTNDILSHNCGKTTSVYLYLLWFILFSEHKKCAILAHKGRAARKILKDIKNTYEYIPHFLQQGIKIWNASYIELENGCSCIADTTSKSGLSGDSINVLYIDELALISQNLFWDFYDSNFPTLSSFENSKIFLSSTAKGLNHWYKIWTDAVQGRNGYNPIRVKWQEVPGRDEKWKENEINKTSIISFSAEQECSFLGSSLTLVEGTHLTNLVYKDSLSIPSTLELHERYIKHVKLYELPKEDHTYVIGVDSSEMQEDSTSDSICLQILDTTTLPIKQVATVLIREGISYLEVPSIAVLFGYFYNTAWLFIELNSTGLEIANKIEEDFKYPNIYRNKNLLGFKTNRKTKKLGCSNLKLLIEKNNLEINDFDTISQLGTFIKSGTSFKADKTYKDDAVMALIGAIFFMQDKDFEGIDQMDFVNGTVKQKEKYEPKQNDICIIDIGEDIISSMFNSELNDTKWMLSR